MFAGTEYVSHFDAAQNHQEISLYRMPLRTTSNHQPTISPA